MKKLLLLILIFLVACTAPIEETPPIIEQPYPIPERTPVSHTLTIKDPIDKPVVVIGFDTERSMEFGTERVLDILEEKGIKATFFVNGDFMEQNPEIMHRIADDHELASHSHVHVTHSLLPFLDQYRLILAQKELAGYLYGIKVTGFRAPFRAYDENTLLALKDLGFKYSADYYCMQDTLIANFNIMPHPTSCLPGDGIIRKERNLLEDDYLFSKMGYTEEEALEFATQVFDHYSYQDEVVIMAMHPNLAATKSDFFVGFIDYALENGAVFMTHASLQEYLDEDPTLLQIT